MSVNVKVGWPLNVKKSLIWRKIYVSRNFHCTFANCFGTNWVPNRALSRNDHKRWCPQRHPTTGNLDGFTFHVNLNVLLQTFSVQIVPNHTDFSSQPLQQVRPYWIVRKQHWLGTWWCPQNSQCPKDLRRSQASFSRKFFKNVLCSWKFSTTIWHGSLETIWRVVLCTFICYLGVGL